MIITLVHSTHFLMLSLYNFHVFVVFLIFSMSFKIISIHFSVECLFLQRIFHQLCLLYNVFHIRKMCVGIHLHLSDVMGFVLTHIYLNVLFS